MPVFTTEILNQGKSRNGFWSNKQIYALGVSEIKKGWKNEVIGKELSSDIINKFLNLKNKHLNNNNNIIIPTPHPYSTIEELKKNIENQIVLSSELLHQGKSSNGGWSLDQLRVFGILEFRKGWKTEILNKEYSTEKIIRFLTLRDKHLKKLDTSFRSKSYDRLGVVNTDIPIVEQYKNKSWIDLKNTILERDNYTCTICKRKYVELHVHHMVYPKGMFIWEIDSKYLIVVCKDCHEKIHDKELNSF